MTGSVIAGLVLTPGASAGRDHPGLVAIDQAVTPLGIAVERVEFPGQAAKRRRPDPTEVCIRTVRTAALELADRLDVPIEQVAIGGRSMGGRMCSMAAAEGLEAAALVLVSYPLHPPGRPDRLRTAHFPELHLPCLFVSGRRDAFGTPLEFELETGAIPGPVSLTFVEGDHSLRKGGADAAEIVASWLAGLTARRGNS
ncbi:MAG: dienelactone hydrolase [Acidimicrobiales bacterium]|nr:dienelactone hydrolase [Acidimicrobiales bacterium]